MKLNKHLLTTLLIFSSLLLSIEQANAQGQGPKAPEAGSFEPVDATDMVSLLTGDVNYVLPLLDVPSPEGSYPLVLAYHAGIAYDQEATWVGLGWNLNPGVINRTINGYPDDWSGGTIRNRNYYSYEVETITVSLGVGEKVEVEIGVGYSWDSNGSQSGSVSLSITEPSTGLSASVGVGYSSSEGWSANAGVSLSRSLKKGSVNGGSIGISGSTNGSLQGSISYGNNNNSIGVSFGTAGLVIQAKSSGTGKASYSSNNSVSADVTSFDASVKIPIGGSTFLKFGYSKVKFEKDELYFNKVWGPLHYNELNNNPKLSDDITYGETISFEHNRDYYMDTYDQPLPQSEKEIIDFDDTFEKYQHSFSNPAYDSYVVNAQGLSGSMKPRLLDNAYLIGKGYKLEYETNNDLGTISGAKVLREIFVDAIENNNPELAAYALLQSGNLTNYLNLFNQVFSPFKMYEKNSAIVNHHFDSSLKFDKKFGNGVNDIHFYFDHQLHSNLMVNQININSSVSSVNNVNDFFSGTPVNRTGRVENTNFIESFTNEEINALINSGGYFFESKDFDRQNQPGALDKGIGGYRITSADGKTYHYSQPVYQYEEFYRQLTPKADSDPDNPQNFSEHRFYHEQRKTEPYATHWLLTAITGPDYIKRSNSSIKHPTEGDYGYWIRFDYGTWTDGYVWRTPKEQETYNNLVFDKTNGVRDYSWGRKQLVYLNKVVTRTHTALLVKSLRDDNEGAQVGGPNYKDFPSINEGDNPEDDNWVNYIPQKSLKLDEIILIKNEDDNVKLDNNYGNLIDNADTSRTVNWNTMTDIFYVINQQKNVLDKNDLQVSSNGNYSIYEKALKVIKFDQDYSLANNADTNQARLTLNSVQFLGKRGATYMPKYEFEYNGKNTDYHYCYDYRDCDKDPWGYYKDDVSLWSMNTIKTPLGSEIKIEYEEDDYYTEAFARRFWTEGLTFQVEDYDSEYYKIIVKNNTTDIVENAWVNFEDYFEVNKKVGLDLWMVRRLTETSSVVDDCDRFGTAFDLDIKRISEDKLPEVVYVNPDKLELIVAKNLGYGDLIVRPLISGMKSDDILTGEELWQSSTCPSSYDYEVKDRGDIPSNPGCSSLGSSNRKRHTMYYGLIANRTPKADMGGGIRAKSVATHSNTGEFFKVEYSYDHPVEGRSSGITSYAPVRGYKYVAYQAELPGPKVNYEYVTMKQVGTDGSSLGATRYHFDVLKPAVNIFEPNLMIGNHFKSEVTEHDLPNETLGADVKLIDNTAMIGSLLDLSEFNSEGHLMSKKINNYKPFEELANTNNGSLQESFLSMKSIYDFNARYVKVPFSFGSSSVGFSVNFTKNLYMESRSSLTLNKRFANVSTKITYPLIQESSDVIANGFKTTTEFFDPDPKTGEFLRTKTNLPNGTSITNIKIPAYENYPQMGSKVTNPNNKNMLTQEAMSITMLGSKTLNASITTWNDKWSYVDELGNKTSSRAEYPVWRKHKSYIWRDAVNPVTGTYNTTVDKHTTYFDWGAGIPTNDKWQEVSEITAYTHWSSPIETRDINNNFASSKSVDYGSKITASGNAKYSEMYYSGAEYIASGNIFEGGIGGAAHVSTDNAHTGLASIALTDSNQKAFEINGQVSSSYDDLSKAFRPQTYKVSVWAHIEGNYFRYSYLQLILNGSAVPVSESERAGKWILLNYYITLDPSTNVNLYFKTGGSYYGSELYLDDFRMHPVSSSMSSYVYDQRTDELIAILDANNVGTVYCYDSGGRLCTTYTEVFGTCESCSGTSFEGAETTSDNHSSGIGGFKLTSKNTYNYIGDDNDNSCSCIGTNENLQQKD